MILLADSGSTKTEWWAVEDHQAVAKVRTRGLNPFQVTMDELAQVVRDDVVPQVTTTTAMASVGLATFAEVHFYGAGCTKEQIPVVADVLRRVLTDSGVLATGAEVEVASDMLGAARAVCGHEAGIACILGTGSNSCEYDGERITRNVPALGYILGDEGSGAVIGRQLVGDILKGVAPVVVRDAFQERYGLTQAAILDRVYRQPQPNQFLASFMPFVGDHISTDYMQELVRGQFTRFLVRNVAQYASCHDVPIGFNGSIALLYRQQLEEALESQGMLLGRIVKMPMEGLVS